MKKAFINKLSSADVNIQMFTDVTLITSSFQMNSS